MTGAFIRRRDLDTDTHASRDKMRSQGEERTLASPGEENNPVDILISDFQTTDS